MNMSCNYFVELFFVYVAENRCKGLPCKGKAVLMHTLVPLKIVIICIKFIFKVFRVDILLSFLFVRLKVARFYSKLYERIDKTYHWYYYV